MIILMSITPRIQGSLVGRKLEEPSSYHRGMRDPIVYSILTLLKNSPSHTHIYTHIHIYISMRYAIGVVPSIPGRPKDGQSSRSSNMGEVFVGNSRVNSSVSSNSKLQMRSVPVWRIK